MANGSRFSLASIALALLLLVGAGFAGWAIRGSDSHDHSSNAAATSDSPDQVEEWTCSMHPQIRAPQAGQCPICGMDLIPVPQGGGDAVDPRTLPMSASAAALAGVRTLPAERRALTVDLRMVGKIAYDETRLSDLTAWMPGRLDRLFVDSTGVPVREGDHLAEIYSPKLFAAQEELLQAAAAKERLKESPIEDLRRTSAATFEAARGKLRLLGLSAAQIDEVLARGEPQVRLTLHAPVGGIVLERLAQEGGWVNEGSVLFRIADLSVLWLELDAYESDLHWLREGQEVRFRVAAYPGESFSGRISLIHPMMRLPSRTVRVRVVVGNEALRLKPGMFASALIQVGIGTDAMAKVIDRSGKWSCPMHPDVLEDGAGDCPICAMPLEPAGGVMIGEHELPLAIPATSPLFTGERSVVYVRVGSDDKPAYEARRVVLGPRAGEWYPVIEGLEEGDRVVVNGAFRLDSELQLRGGESMMHASEPTSEAALEQPQADVGPGLRRELGTVLLGLEAATAAFAADDLASAHAALEETAATLAAVDLEQAPALHRGHLKMSLAQLGNGLAAVRAADEIEAARAALQVPIAAALALVEAFGYSFEDGRRLVLINCPMAFDGEGGDWLQFAGTDTANPYFGESMLRCGDEVRELPTGEPQ